MPGVVMMADGDQTGARTDHDRDNGGVNGKLDAKKGDDQNTTTMTMPLRPRMNDLPDEIVHITQGFVPLSMLLTRLAQRTHNSLQEKIAELAKMPLPAAATNGNNTNHSGQGPDDTSAENLRKKANLLHFTQDMHAKWVKTLVITEWSRNSALVSKLIDLKFHMDQQRMLYDGALENMINVKRDLTYARMPSPDLKTALQILSTGNAPWIPDLGYIEPPPLTADEKLRWINDLDTLLSLRLNLDDYDKIPPQFKAYEIGSGRVKFKVPGEFEVELTIADEDFEKQFWFIDFRYAFTPCASTIPDSLRTYLEACVNDVLSKDGLVGCYKFLHEFVLTSKIHELKRQAVELSKTSWSGTLVVEPLNRALAIQYWSSRTATTGLKNWILIAVDSGKQQQQQHQQPSSSGPVDGKSTSKLTAKWYRDNKEVKEVMLDFDVQTLSAASLLKDVVGRHIEFILSNIHIRLQDAPRFKKRESSMHLSLSSTEPASCALSMEVGHDDAASLLMEPTTGIFAMKPQSKFSVQYEMQLNNGKNASEDGVSCLENLRCAIIEDKLHRRGSAMGWNAHKSPLVLEELRSVTKLRDWTRVIWMQRDGWGPNWFVAVVLSLAGDEWWLIEANPNETGRRTKLHAKLPLSKGLPDLSNKFWTNLTLFATGMIAQAVDMRELHSQRIKSRPINSKAIAPSQQVRLPSIEVDLSAMIPSMVADISNSSGGPDNKTSTPDGGGRRAWANNVIVIRFRGVQPAAPNSMVAEAAEEEEKPTTTITTTTTTTTTLTCISDALLKVRNPSKFATLNGIADRDLSYDSTKGEFCLQIHHSLGQPALSILQSRIKSIDRFVNFLTAVDNSQGKIVADEVTLQRASFSYEKWRMTLDLSEDDIGVSIDNKNPHLRVLDLMRRLVNGRDGITGLVGWLPISLPALNALDAMEAEWESLRDMKLGEASFAVKTLSWMSVRYSIPGRPDTATLEVQAKLRGSETWWHVYRSDTPQNAARARQNDMFAKALKEVWSKSGKKWIGLETGAAGKPDGGVVEMMLDVDEAIRNAVQNLPKVKKEEDKDIVILD